MNRLLPVMLSVEGRRCVVVGGGTVALRKAMKLLACGAHITVIAPEACDKLAVLATDGTVAWERRRFEQDDVAGATLVVAATDDVALNARIARLCDERSIPVNVAKPGRAGSVIFPAALRHGSFTAAFSSDGGSPLAARIAREDVESRLPLYDEIARELAVLRGGKLTEGDELSYNEKLLRTLAGHHAVLSLAGGRADEAEALARRMIGILGKRT